MKISNVEMSFLDWCEDTDECTLQQWKGFINFWQDTARKYNYYHMLVTEIKYGKYKDGSEYVIITPKAVFTEAESLVTFLLNDLEYKDVWDLDIRASELTLRTKCGSIHVNGLPLNTVNTNRGYEVFKFDKNEPWQTQ
jgi:hypothetical protein